MNDKIKELYNLLNQSKDFGGIWTTPEELESNLRQKGAVEEFINLLNQSDDFKGIFSDPEEFKNIFGLKKKEGFLEFPMPGQYIPQAASFWTIYSEKSLSPLGEEQKTKEGAQTETETPVEEAVRGNTTEPADDTVKEEPVQTVKQPSLFKTLAAGGSVKETFIPKKQVQPVVKPIISYEDTLPFDITPSANIKSLNARQKYLNQVNDNILNNFGTKYRDAVKNLQDEFSLKVGQGDPEKLRKEFELRLSNIQVALQNEAISELDKQAKEYKYLGEADRKALTTQVKKILDSNIPVSDKQNQINNLKAGFIGKLSGMPAEYKKVVEGELNKLISSLTLFNEDGTISTFGWKSEATQKLQKINNDWIKYEKDFKEKYPDYREHFVPSEFGGEWVGDIASTDPEERKRFYNDYNRYKRDKLLVDTAREKLENILQLKNDRGSFGDFFRYGGLDLVESLQTLGWSDVANGLKDMSIARKVRSGEELSPGERAVFDAYAIYDGARQNLDSAGFKFGETLTTSLELGGAIALSGGLGLTKGLGEQTMKQILKESAAKLFSREGAKVLGREFVKWGTGMAKAAPIMPISWTRFETGLAGNKVFDSEGNWVVDKSSVEGFGEALIKGLATGGTEYGSEVLGGYIGEFGGLLKKIPGLKNVKLPKGLLSAFSAMGVQSAPIQMLEELINIPLQSPIGDQPISDVTPQDLWDIVWSSAALTTTLGSLGLPGSVMSAIKRNRDYNVVKMFGRENVKKVRDAIIFGDKEGLLRAVKEAIKGKTATDFDGMSPQKAANNLLTYARSLASEVVVKQNQIDTKDTIEESPVPLVLRGYKGKDITFNSKQEFFDWLDRNGELNYVASDDIVYQDMEVYRAIDEWAVNRQRQRTIARQDKNVIYAGSAKNTNGEVVRDRYAVLGENGAVEKVFSIDALMDDKSYLEAYKDGLKEAVEKPDKIAEEYGITYQGQIEDEDGRPILDEYMVELPDGRFANMSVPVNSTTNEVERRLEDLYERFNFTYIKPSLGQKAEETTTSGQEVNVEQKLKEEPKNAERIGTETKETGESEAPAMVAGEEERLRVRGVEEDRVETGPGKEVTTKQEEIASKLKEQLLAEGYEVKEGSLSATIHGTSKYLYVNRKDKPIKDNLGLGVKVRISDHSVESPRRLADEVMLYKPNDINRAIGDVEQRLYPERFEDIEEQVSRTITLETPKPLPTDKIISQREGKAGHTVYTVEREKKETVKKTVRKEVPITPTKVQETSPRPEQEGEVTTPPSKVEEVPTEVKKEQKSILNQKTDLLGQEKEEAMIPAKAEERQQVGDVVTFIDRNGDEQQGNFRGIGQDGKAVIDVQQKKDGRKFFITFLIPLSDVKFPKFYNKESIGAIEYAIENNLYQDWIKEGRMTAEDARTIIESAGLEVPQELSPTKQVEEKPPKVQEDELGQNVHVRDQVKAEGVSTEKSQVEEIKPETKPEKKGEEIKTEAKKAKEKKIEEVKGKIADDFDDIMSYIGGIKQLSAEQREGLIKAIIKLIEDLAEYTALKGKELFEKLKEALGERKIEIPEDILQEAWDKYDSSTSPAAHRKYIEDKFRKEFSEKGIPEEQIDGAIALMSARAEVWAKETGRNADEWYERIADVKSGEFQNITPALKQEGEKGLPLFQRNVSDIEEYFERYNELEMELLHEMLNAKKGQRQKWDLIKKNRLIKIWNDFAKTGVVRDEKGLDEIEELIIDNTIKLRFNTAIAGHFPWNEIENLRYKYELSEKDVDKINNLFEDTFFEAENGQLRISDYGLEPLERIVVELIKSKSAEERLLLIDQALNIVHQRSDFASMFVEGGSDTLTELAERQLMQINNPKSKKPANKISPQGAVEFLEDGRAVIIALNSPDFSTMVHEIFHVFEKDLSEDEIETIEKWSGYSRNTREYKEAFARAGERYLYDGIAPNDKLRKIFAKFKQWLRGIYRKIKGSPIEKQLSPEMRAIFDRLIAGEEIENNLEKSFNEDHKGEPELKKDPHGLIEEPQRADSIPEVRTYPGEEVLSEVTKKRQKGYLSRLRYSEQVTERIKQLIDEVGLEYTQFPNNITSAEADALVEKYGFEKIWEDVINPAVRMPASIRKALLVRLLFHYQKLHEEALKEGNKAEAEIFAQKALRVAEFTDRANLEAGRFTQYDASEEVSGLLDPVKNVRRMKRLVRDQRDQQIEELREKLKAKEEEIEKLRKKGVDDLLKSKEYEEAKQKLTKKVKERPVAKKESQRAEIVRLQKYIDKRWEDFVRAGKGTMSTTIIGLTNEQIEILGDIAAAYIKKLAKQGRYLIDEVIEMLQKQIKGKTGLTIAREDLETILPTGIDGKPTDDYLKDEFVRNASEKLAKRVVKLLDNKDVPSSNPIKQMIDILFYKVKEKFPEEASTFNKKSALEKIRETLDNKEKYASVWEAAKNEVKVMIDGQDDWSGAMKSAAHELLDNFYNEVIGRPYSEKLVEQAIRDELQRRRMEEDEDYLGRTIDEIVRNHYFVRDVFARSIADRLIEELDMNEEDARLFESMVMKKFTEMTERKAISILKQGMRSKLPARKAEPEYQKLLKIISLGAFSRPEFVEYYSDALGLPKITEKQAKEMEALAQKIATTDYGYKKFEYIQDLYNYIAKIPGIDYGNISMAIWYANILFGERTQWKNIFGNAFNFILEFMVSTVRALITFNPHFIPVFTMGAAKGMKEGWDNMLYVFRTGYSPLKYSKIELGVNELERWRFVGGALNPFNCAKYVFRMMSGVDMFFYSGFKEYRAYELALQIARKKNRADGKPRTEDFALAYEILNNNKERFEEARIQAEQEGYKGMGLRKRITEIIELERDPGVVEAAHSFASRGTYNYQPEGLLGMVTAAITKMVDGVVLKPKLLGHTFSIMPLKFLIPFTRIITNVGNTALSYTPAGLIRAVNGYIGVKHFKETTSKYYRELTPEERGREFIKFMLGFTTWTAAMMLSEPPDDKEEPILEITANGTGDYNKNQQLEATGWRKYTIKFRGSKTRYSYQYTPFVLILAPVGWFRDMQKYHPESFQKYNVWDIFAGQLMRSLSAMGDMTWLANAAGLMESFSARNNAEFQQFWGRFLVSTAKGFFYPKVIEQTLQMYDEIAKNPRRYSTKFFGKMIKDLPIIRNNFPVQYNILGRPVLADFTEMVNWDTDDDYANFLGRYLYSYGLALPFPDYKSSAYTVLDVEKEEERQMTDEEFMDFVRNVGLRTEEVVREKVMSRDLSEMAVEDIQKEILSLYNKTRDIVKTEMFGYGEWRMAHAKEWEELKKYRAVQVPPLTAPLYFDVEKNKYMPVTDKKIIHEYQNKCLDFYYEIVMEYVKSNDAVEDRKNINPLTGEFRYVEQLDLIWDKAKEMGRGWLTEQIALGAFKKS